MIIGSVSENKHFEKRIAVTPEIIKKYAALGFEVRLSENYGSHLGITDDQFKEMGVKTYKHEIDILNSSDIIVQLGMLSEDKISILRENQTLIGGYSRIILLIHLFRLSILFLLDGCVLKN